jgi:hypothetical protein
MRPAKKAAALAALPKLSDLFFLGHSLPAAAAAFLAPRERRSMEQPCGAVWSFDDVTVTWI